MGGDVVVSNLAFLVGTLGALPGSRLLSDPGGLVACDSGIGEAYENYALLIPRTLDFNGPEKLDSTDEIEKLVASGREFFARETSPHIWPLFPSSFASPEALRRARLLLESVGAREEGTFFGMEADVDSTKIPLHDDNAYSGRWLAKSGSLVSLDTEFSSDLSDWADAVWLGFDSGEPAPADFTRFVREAAFADGISLFALRSLSGGTVAATGLLCACYGTAGIYYVSTRPEYRKRGLGRRVMKALIERASELDCARSSLLATGSGRSLYLKCGFRETSRVTIMRLD